MTALDGGPHGVTETAAAQSTRYRATASNGAFIATYCLSILQSFADGQQPNCGETPQEYAQRHLAQLESKGYIEQKAEVPA